MDCEYCNKSDVDVELFDGLAIGRVVKVCSSCADEEKIPLLSKPSVFQLEKADEHKSVRERMERLSGFRDKSSVNVFSSHESLSRLRPRPKKMSHPSVVDNYDWNLSVKRRRLKLSLSQLSSRTGVSRDDLFSIEHGRIPDHFVEIFSKLEDVLGIELLKERPEKVRFLKKEGPSEEEILASVRERMSGRSSEEVADDVVVSSGDDEVVSKGDSTDDLSSRDRVTLNDLIDRKRRLEREKAALLERKNRDSLLGDDLDLE